MMKSRCLEDGLKGCAVFEKYNFGRKVGAVEVEEDPPEPTLEDEAKGSSRNAGSLNRVLAQLAPHCSPLDLKNWYISDR